MAAPGYVRELEKTKLVFERLLRLFSAARALISCVFRKQRETRHATPRAIVVLGAESRNGPQPAASLLQASPRRPRPRPRHRPHVSACEAARRTAGARGPRHRRGGQIAEMLANDMEAVLVRAMEHCTRHAQIEDQVMVSAKHPCRTRRTEMALLEIFA